MAELFDQDLDVVDATQAPETPSESPDTSPGARIAALRRAKRLSRHEVARAAGFTVREIAAFEQGRRQLTANDRFCLAGSLGVDPDELAAVVDGVPETVGTADEVAWLAIVRNDEDGLDDDEVLTVDALRALSEPAPSDDTNTADLDGDVDPKTREVLDRRWQDVQAQLDAAAERCRLLAAAGPDQDVARLVADVEAEARRLRKSRTFRRSASRHRKALRRYQRSRRTTTG